LTAAAAESIIEQAVKALAAGGRVILNVGLPPVSERTAARLLAVRLVEVAESVLSRTAVERVYVEGGATAVELARRMGWARLAVLDELAPGVARLAPADHGTVVLTIKPGTYVWPEAIVKG
jgi:D-threonate/D-erythronate kinase